MQEQKSVNHLPVGLIIDESCHLKKGTESVGVTRQYAGQLGKVDNCQVAVYASLCNNNYCTLISSRLFLPESWTSNPERMEKAKIPEEYRGYKTKPELALKIIDDALLDGVLFDRIGGDGLYGHNSELTRSLDERGLFYVLDVHKDEHIYLEEPQLSIPPRKTGRGRIPCKMKPHVAPVSLDKYYSGLKATDWQKAKIRKTAKGTKTVKVLIAKVWHWNGEEDKACPRTPVITIDEKSRQVKFSFSNGAVEEYSPKEYARFQCNRYWVERCFDDSKNEIGLSGYQVRHWLAWNHHVALVMMASLYLVKRRIENNEEYPLMSWIIRSIPTHFPA